MRKLTALIFLAILSVSSTKATADQTFSDEASWQAALTSAVQDRVASDYSNLVVNDLQVTVPISQPWGEIGVFDSGFDPVLPITVGEGVVDATTVGLVFDSSVCLQLDIDPSSGPLEGFGFTVSGISGINVRLLDGETVLANFDGLATPEVEGEFAEEFFGWINCSNSNVTRIEVCPAAGTTFNGFVGGTFSFNPISSDPTCQDQLQGILDVLANVRESASNNDQYWIDWAIYDLTCAQDEMLWKQKTGCRILGPYFLRTCSGRHTIWNVLLRNR